MNTVIYILLGIIAVLLVIAMIKISSLEKKLAAGSDSAEIKNEIARSRTETLPLRTSVRGISSCIHWR